jgi:hypothetical protein
LTWYRYVIQGWHESLRQIPKIEASINYLMDKLPKAEVIELEAYKAKLDELLKLSQLSVIDVIELGRKEMQRTKRRQNGC